MMASFAYCTLLTSASYLPGVIVLANSLRRHGSQYPLVVYYTSALSMDAIKAMKLQKTSLNLILRKCESIKAPIGSAICEDRYAEAWSKLRVFDIFSLGFELVCFLDADMAIFNGNMDDIFQQIPVLEWNEIASVHDCICGMENRSGSTLRIGPDYCAWRCANGSLHNSMKVLEHGPLAHHMFNAGMFIYRPSLPLAEYILHSHATSDHLAEYRYAEQDFLIQVFKDRWHSLSWEWNAYKVLRYRHADIWDDEKVRCLHYVLEKPWQARQSSQVDPLSIDTETHSWWWEEYRIWAARGNKDAVEIVERYVN